MEKFKRKGSTIVPSQKVYPEDTCILLSSSGTTGLPKGVKLSHRNFIAVIQLARNSFDVRSFDILYMILPMFHSFGAAVMSLGLAQGITLIVRRRYSIETFFHDVEKYKITCMQAVPPIVLDIHNSSLNTRYDTSSLKKIMTAAAPLPHGVAELVKKKLGISVYQGWGTTEALPLTVSTPNTLIPIESVGCVVSNTKIKVVDPVTGKELLPNQSGEILAKGPQVMAGYYKNPTATAETIDKNGWYHTGDIGYYDKYGLLYVVDRLKEMIKYKGFQVAPAELEEVLLRHPGISDAAVIGIPDQKAGEVPKAYVVKKNQQLTSNEIHEFLKDKVSSFKHLRGGIVFRDSIPKSASGKILRRELRVLERNSKL